LSASNHDHPPPVAPQRVAGMRSFAVSHHDEPALELVGVAYCHAQVPGGVHHGRGRAGRSRSADLSERRHGAGDQPGRQSSIISWGSPLLPARGTAARRNSFNPCRGSRVCSAGPADPKDRMQRTKLEIPFGHAFDRREVSSPKSVVRACVPSVCGQPSRSAPYSGRRAALEDVKGHFDRQVRHSPMSGWCINHTRWRLSRRLSAPRPRSSPSAL
jgi:hypothetical protein